MWVACIPKANAISQTGMFSICVMWVNVSAIRLKGGCCVSVPSCGLTEPVEPLLKEKALRR